MKANVLVFVLLACVAETAAAATAEKDLLPADVTDLQHTSEGSPGHWTMNHTIDNILGRERKVCNQLLFVATGN